MPRAKPQEVSSDKDLKKVKDLIKKRQLDQVVSKLDPDNIRGTLNEVPVEVIRLLTHVLSISNIEERVGRLVPDQRRPIAALLRAAQQHNGREFVSRLVKEASKDEQLRSSLGIRAVDTAAQELEAKTRNSVTNLKMRPLLMLASSRLYCSVSFTRGESLLFQSDFEIDDLLWMASGFLEAASQTLDGLRKNAQGVEAEIDVSRCQELLETIQKTARSVSRALRAKPTRSKKTKKKRRKARVRS